ncbi:MAG: hypothetical protein OXG36_18940 [Caldilineaceae bacterium]|nr:hypothetical protein [Caldilineaceae bacterium]
MTTPSWYTVAARNAPVTRPARAQIWRVFEAVHWVTFVARINPGGEPVEESDPNSLFIVGSLY